MKRGTADGLATIRGICMFPQVRAEPMPPVWQKASSHIETAFPSRTLFRNELSYVWESHIAICCA